jgi:predicted GIY-YIG superfamily endonuclease
MKWSRGDPAREAAQEMEPAWKIELIEKANPRWQDLWPEII